MQAQTRRGTTVPAPHTLRNLSARGPLAGLLGLTAFATLFAGEPASAQTTFSVDYKGPSIALFTEGDIVMPAAGFPMLGPLPAPVIAIPGGGGAGSLGIGTYLGCVGHAPGVACGVEVDALTYGLDTPAKPMMPPGSYYFSVESFATGFPTGFPGPNVMTESGVAEAASDVFCDLGIMMPAPVPPFGSPPGNAAVIDGNGTPIPSPFAYPGVGTVEPTAGFCALVEAGDNLDAVDVDGPLAFPAYFSLDAGFLDVPCGFPLGGSAMANGYLPGDVLIAPGTGVAPGVWIPSLAMGLDLMGPGQDDLDALAIWENGSGAWENAGGPYGWIGGGADMVIFSVREGSAIIGTPDSLLGVPIEAGDLLIPPAMPGFPPQMYIAAENLGLATFRSGFGTMDDLDALDVVVPSIPPLDKDGDLIPDIVLIILGLVPDCNGDLIPDSVQNVAYCTAGTSASGCMATLSAAGTPSATATSGFTVVASTVEGNKDGLYFYGTNGRQASAWGNGTSFQCVVPPVKRGGLLLGSGTSGACDGSFTQDLNARWCPTCPKPSHNPGAGSVVQIQLWYRDPMNTSNQTTSLSNALEFVVCP